MGQIAQEGGSYVRLTAGWSGLAPSPRSKTKPDAPFDASDSGTYPADGFRRLDTAVKAAAQAGLRVQMDVAFWAPRWAVPKASDRNDRERYSPKPAEFGLFARALARRYSGAFADPDEKGKALPAVRLWATWNEPNHPAFLMPQWRRSKSGLRPESPHVYRWLHNAAYSAIKSVSPQDEVLLGNTAPTANGDPGKGGVPPLRFLRDMACVDGNLKPLDVPECRSFQPIRADGYAHHPYSRTSPPSTADPDPDDVPLANIDRLEGLLDQLADRGRIVGKLPLYLNEYGYETSPPDPTATATPDQQAQWMGQSTYMAFRDPRVKLFAQFGLRDIDPRESGAAPGAKGYWATGRAGCSPPTASPSRPRWRSSSRSGRRSRPRPATPTSRRWCSSARSAARAAPRSSTSSGAIPPPAPGRPSRWPARTATPAPSSPPTAPGASCGWRRTTATPPTG
jgi:hypothetical protein